MSEITLFLFIRRFWEIISKLFAQINFKYQQIKRGFYKQVKVEAMLNYFIPYFDSTSVDISAKRKWGFTLKLQLVSWYTMLWQLGNIYNSLYHFFCCSYLFYNWKRFHTTLSPICINWVPGYPLSIFLVTSFTRKMPES